MSKYQLAAEGREGVVTWRHPDWHESSIVPINGNS
jgi:hypothetical protein